MYGDFWYESRNSPYIDAYDSRSMDFTCGKQQLFWLLKSDGATQMKCIFGVFFSKFKELI